jgi:hypothetical protein
VGPRTEVRVEVCRMAGQANPSGYIREASTSSFLSEVTDSRLPRKTSKLQAWYDRTANRHR